MKLLLAGDFNHYFYEEACAKAFERLGIDVVRFSWGNHFKSFKGRLQFRVMLGPALWILNRDLRRKAEITQPDVILVWRGNPVFPSTLTRLKRKTDALLASYHNDNPFGLTAGRRTWALFMHGIPLYDLHFVYRHSNINQFSSAGAKEIHMLRSYFLPELHRPVTLTNEEERRFRCEAVFAGHYEPDGRVKYLAALNQAGIHLRLFGGTWETKQTLGCLPESFWPVIDVRGEAYVKALCGADMALNFLSQINQDTYTRRCFEIPACGRLLLSQRTDDLLSMFQEDEEAVFFSSSEELVTKALALKANPKRLRAITRAGYERVIRDRHDVYSRMEDVLQILRPKMT